MPGFASTAEYYHEQTKYRPETLGRGHGLDWNTKPVVFKSYAGAERIGLRKLLSVRTDSLPARTGGDEGSVAPSLSAISRLLFFTNGVTATAENPGEPGGHSFFRAAPSAGALYPTELYVAVRNHGRIPSGIYNVDLRSHDLQRISPPGFGPEGDELFHRLSEATLGHPAVAASDFVVIATAVWQRSAWRYGPRAYRRCMLDTGHVLGNLAAYAPTESFAAVPLGGFIDDEVNGLLGVDAKVEGTVAVVPLVLSEQVETLPTPMTPTLRSSMFGGVVEAAEDDLLQALALRSEVSRKEAALAGVSQAMVPLASLRMSKYRFSPGVQFSADLPDFRHDLPLTILRRRSTRAFSGAPVRLEDLAKVLEYAYRPDLGEPRWASPRFFDAGQLETWVVAQGIDGLAPGVYLYAPESRELRLVDLGDYRRETHYLALGQDLAGLAGAVVFHTCDLPAAVKRFGDRAYRLMHLDAGHLGQRMNLACIALGLGVSGIGGFLDEEVNALLAIPEREACVYITCIGQPAVPSDSPF